jgi:uncharacterized protein (TIGR03435 family)
VPQEQQMMQSLLADRFQFKAHHEIRQMPIYELVIAKKGLRMKEATPDEQPTETMSAGKLTAHAMTIESITYGFAGSVARIILDKTDLSGKKFDFELTYALGNQPDDSGPSLFTAFEEQLGLKLIPAKGPVDVVVIEHIAKPSPN